MINIQEYVNPKYHHQLHYFTNEAQEIRAYIKELNKVGIINNNNNTHFLKNIVDYDSLAQKICVFTEKSQHYEVVKKMLKTDQAISIILILLFKGFSWRNELFNHFNISHTLYVNNTLLTLSKLNLIDKEKGDEINRFFYEAINKSTSYQTTKALHQANLYYINKKFIKFCSMLKPLFEHIFKNTDSCKSSVSKVIRHCSLFERVYEGIINEEISADIRRYRTDDGVIYQIDTLRTTHNSKAIKNALTNAKIEILQKKEKQNLLTSEEKSMLADIKKNSLVKFDEKYKNSIVSNRKMTIFYNGEEIDFADKILEEHAKKQKEIEEAPLQIGKIELINEKTIFDGGLYLSPTERMKWVQIEKPRTAEQEAEEFFAGLI